MLALASTTVAVAPASAQGSLDVRAWLERPGVKLLAVEFYATWCKPCMEAVPKWKALHEKYRADGLRLVVVATQDPAGACANPGWNPDEVVCDEDGAIARALGAAERLPSAFLWSWQGDRLVRAGHVDEVERAVDGWLRTAPRVGFGKVEVEKATGIDKTTLQAMLRSEIDRTGKLLFVASAEERARLDKLVAESLRASNDERLACEAGKHVPANALLDVRTVGDRSRPRLHLALLSAESGCQVAAAVTDWDGRKAEASVAEAVAELMGRLRSDPEMSNVNAPLATEGRVRTSKTRLDFGGTVRNERPGDRGFLVVRAKTAPVVGDVGDAGKYVAATVNVDSPTPVGTTRGERGWSSAAPLVAGTHRVTVTYQDEEWEPAQQDVVIRDGETAEVEFELRPRFGLVEVDSTPQGAHVDVNGRRASTLTPVRGLRVPAGDATLQVALDDYVPAQVAIRVNTAQVTRVERSLEPDFGTLVVKSDPAGARVRVDGSAVGVTPLTLERQAAGPHEVGLSMQGHAPNGAVTVVERGKASTVQVKLDPYFGRLLVTSTLRSAEGEADCRATAVVRRNGEIVATKTTPAEFRDLLAVEHEVEIDCSGARETKRVLVKHNEDVTLPFLHDERETRRTTDERLASLVAACAAEHRDKWCSERLGQNALDAFDHEVAACRSGDGRSEADCRRRLAEGVTDDELSSALASARHALSEEADAGTPRRTPRLRPAAAEPPPPGNSPVSSAEEAPQTARLVSGLALFAAAAATTVCAIYFGVRASEIDRELEAAAPTTPRADISTSIADGKNAALVSDVMVGTALATALAGALVIKF